MSVYSNGMMVSRWGSKYGAKRSEYNGRSYDSKFEAGLAAELDMRMKAGEFTKVEPQITFPLYGKNGTKVCSHRPDFLATMPDGSQQVYEAKGLAMGEWKIKAALFTDNYPDILYNVIHQRQRYTVTGRRRV